MDNLVNSELLPAFFFKNNKYFMLNNFCISDIQNCLQQVNSKVIDKWFINKTREIFNKRKKEVLEDVCTSINQHHYYGEEGGKHEFY